VLELQSLQRALLGAAIDATRPGGVIAYATCSPHRSETVDVVTDVITGRDDVTEVDVRSLLPRARTSDSPYLQLWPHRDGTDAMFVALVRRGDHLNRPITDSEKS
jgi:16S rRNA (cytosine967-C5)-methyltransferase